MDFKTKVSELMALGYKEASCITVGGCSQYKFD